MRRLIALVTCAACGRIGFDASGNDGRAGDDGGSGSGSGSGLCRGPGYGDTFDEIQPCQQFGMPLVTNGGLATSNGTLTITPNAGANTMVGCSRGGSLFAEPGAFVEVSQVVPAPGQTLLLVQIAAKSAAIIVTPPQISFIDPSANTVSSTYDPVAMRWWRIRPYPAGTLAETSPDGKTWTKLAGTGTMFAGTGTVAIVVQTASTNQAPGAAKIEGIDVCPP